MRYVGRDLSRPELVPRTMIDSQRPTLISEHSNTSNSQNMTATPLLSSSSTTQSLSPVKHGQAVRHDSLNVSGVTSNSSTGGASIARTEPSSSLPVYRTLGGSPSGTQRTGTDSGQPHSFISEQRNSLYSRSVISRPQHRDTMQCLRCGARYPITNLDAYEKHIRDCYSELQ